MQYGTLREPSLISFLLAARVQKYALDCVEDEGSAIGIADVVYHILTPSTIPDG